MKPVETCPSLFVKNAHCKGPPHTHTHTNQASHILRFLLKPLLGDDSMLDYQLKNSKKHAGWLLKHHSFVRMCVLENVLLMPACVGNLTLRDVLTKFLDVCHDVFSKILGSDLKLLLTLWFYICQVSTTRCSASLLAASNVSLRKMAVITSARDDDL